MAIYYLKIVLKNVRSIIPVSFYVYFKNVYILLQITKLKVRFLFKDRLVLFNTLWDLIL